MIRSNQVTDIHLVTGGLYLLEKQKKNKKQNKKNKTKKKRKQDKI